jgi:hypothetical protein
LFCSTAPLCLNFISARSQICRNTPVTFLMSIYTSVCMLQHR